MTVLPEPPYEFYREEPEPVEEQHKAFLVDGIIEAAGFMVDPLDGEVRPCVSFNFTVQGRPLPIPPITYLCRTRGIDEVRAMGRMWRKHAQSLERVKNKAQGMRVAREADADAPVVHCAGCGVRLFGSVSTRGGCIDCYPDLPPGEPVTVGDDA